MAPKCISMLLLAILVAAATVVVNADAAPSSRPSYRRPLPPLPCIPGRQRPSWMPPCSPPPAQPAECYTSLSGLATPCSDFLTNPDVAAPAAACCDGLASLVGDAPICLCHVVNGDLNKLLPAPMMRLRLPQLRRMCAVGFPRTTLRECIRKAGTSAADEPSTVDVAADT
ncbi:hypothetical protein U9M48_015172 [Paspalum notatum var. saurae]|uniref:Bifunctional inhibitor/plant lipid transfer protein/seed storage helical domain-containing protein n=1 Tax=Paspalum notatum var. saurae TaxID=547442 RepID=A0AAQ3WLE9_PASNO